MGIFSDTIQAFQQRGRLKADVAVQERELLGSLAHVGAIQQAEQTVAAVEPKGKNIDSLDVEQYYSASLAGNTLPAQQDRRNRMLVGTLTYEDSKVLSHSSLIGAIISTRVNQIAEYTTPQKRPEDIGFRIELADPAEAMTAAAYKEARRIQQMILTCGDPSVQEHPNFEYFTRVFMRDSLTYDQGCAEILADAMGRPAAWIPVDASTIRRRQPTAKQIANGYRRLPQFVQTIEGRETARWDYDEFLFFIRRGTTDINRYGYGYSEIEQMVRAIISFMNAEDYNSANFTSGIHAQGILLLMSQMSPEKFNRLDDRLREMMTGPRNAHRYILQQLDAAEGVKEDLKHIPLSYNNRDMEYMQWLNYNIKILCAAYQMDPAELGMVFGNEGQTNSLSTQGPAERIAASKERGLRPLLRQYEHMLNTRIVGRINPDFRLRFGGFDTLDPLKQADLDYKRCTTYMSINELRAEKDLPLIPNPLFDIPGGAAIMGMVNQQQQAASTEGGSGGKTLEEILPGITSTPEYNTPDHVLEQMYKTLGIPFVPNIHVTAEVY